MPFADRPGVKRLLEIAEDRFGIAVEPTREVQRLRQVEEEYGEFRNDAEELALQSLDHFGGRPQASTRAAVTHRADAGSARRC
jgi:hypothetical protein